MPVIAPIAGETEVMLGHWPVTSEEQVEVSAAVVLQDVSVLHQEQPTCKGSAQFVQVKVEGKQV